MRKYGVRVDASGKIESIHTEDGGRTWMTESGTVLRGGDIYEDDPSALTMFGVFMIAAAMLGGFAACLFKIGL